VEVALDAKSARYKTRAILRGEVNEDFTVEPNSVDFGSLRPGEEVVRTVVFRPKALKKLEVTVPKSSGIPFEILAKEPKGEGVADTNYELSITFHAPTTASRQTFSDSINVTTSSKRVPTVSIPVSGKVVPDIEISPEVVILPANGISGESRFTLLTAQPSRLVRITGKTSAGPKEIQTAGEKKNIFGDWGMSHTFRIVNSALTTAERIDVALEVQHGSDRLEARSVSVQIKGLAN
jgi:hypothetical protein